MVPLFLPLFCLLWRKALISDTMAFRHNSSLDSINVIKNNIEKKRDLFKRNKFYNKIDLDNSFPEYILRNKRKFKNWIL